MRLTIDTGTDSKDDLRRVIRFLQLFVNEHDFRTELGTKNEEPAAPTALGDFFSNLDKQEPPKDNPSPSSFKLDFF